MSNQIHDLKIYEEHFEAKLKGLKAWEIRLDDRGYSVGDTLRLCEIRSTPCAKPDMFEYTGRVIVSEIEYILRGHKGLGANYVVMSDRVISQLVNYYPNDALWCAAHLQKSAIKGAIYL
jgi:hypothetical protein